MSAIQEQILDAVKILANNAVNRSNATITIECEIVDIVDAAVGSYMVKYLENEFEVYSNPSTIYQIGDIVFVLVPDGDLTKTKTIIGGVAPSASMYVDIENENNYTEVSDNLLNAEDININLCTYYSEVSSIPIDTNGFSSIMEDYIQNYNSFLFSAKIKTNIPMDRRNIGNYGLILTLPIKENKVIINSQGEEEVQEVESEKVINLDVNTIQGNPYGLNEFSLQNLYFEFADGTKYDISRNPTLTKFVQDFPQDPNINNPDIWINEISLKAINVLTEEDKSGYYLTLTASEGNYFLDSRYSNSKKLTPILKVNGKNKKLNGYECYWFVEDSSIGTNSDGYFALAGLGWKCLNNKTNINYNEEGRMTYQYVNDVYNLTVLKDNVVFALRYKCMLIKGDVVVTAKILIKNLSSNILLKLSTASGSVAFVKNVGYVNLLAKIYYPGISDNIHSSAIIDTSWQRFDKNDNFIDSDFYEIIKVNDIVEIDNKKWLETEIKFPCSEIEDLNRINCTFYKTTVNEDKTIGRVNLGTTSIAVTTSADFVYKLSIQNGDVLYKYDADGDSPAVADYDGPLTSRISEYKPLTYRIHKADGTELTDTEYLYCKSTWLVPKNSMIKLNESTRDTSNDTDDYYVVKDKNELHYKILDTYNVKKSNNTIILQVNFQDYDLMEVANIKFIKDGESGTNGSKYTGIVTYEGYGYGDFNSSGKPHKFHPVYINQVGWKLCDSTTGNIKDWNNDVEKFDVDVYKDGELITSNSEVSYSVTWKFFDYSVTKPNFDLNSSLSETYCYINKNTDPEKNRWIDDKVIIVEAKVTITDNSVTNSSESLYAYYPVELSYISSNITTPIVPNLEGGFTQVLYASDGTNPKYDNTNPFIYADNLKELDMSNEGFNFDWDVGEKWGSNNNSNLKGSYKKDESGTEQRWMYVVKPTTKYDNGKSQNFVKVTMTLPQSVFNRLIVEKNNKQNELNRKSAERAYKIDIESHILDFAKKFACSYKEQGSSATLYLPLLKDSMKLLNYRGNMIYYANVLLSILGEIDRYCNENNIQTEDFDWRFEPTLEAIQNAIKKLFKLGYDSSITLGSLDDLSNLKYSLILSINNFKEKYGFIVYDNINSLIESFNNNIIKYQNNYIILTAKNNNNYVYINEFNQYTILVSGLIGLVNDDDLNWLQVSHTYNGIEFEPEQEYLNLKNLLESITMKIYEDYLSCYMYDDINNSILLQFKNIFEKYQSKYYKNNLDLEINQLNKEIDKLNREIDDYEKVLADPNNNTTIKHIKPIIMTFNRYELSNINGWDGNKLYIDGNNESYLLAPQIGAGVKNQENNTFTGLVMGIKQVNSNSNQQIGLFGYSSGVQSLFLNAEDGSATFGKSGGGQVIIDPSKDTAIIKSGNYSTTNKTGMQIDLTTPEIRFGSGNFIVNSSGHLTAKGGGSIAGWNIDDHNIYSNVSTSQGRLTLNSEGTGKIYSHNHNSLTTSGTGFYLSSDGMSIGSKVYIDSSGVMKLGNGAVNDSSNRHWTIDVNESESYIAYGGTAWAKAINSDGTTAKVYIGTDGLSIGTRFSVSYQGELTAYSGDIGGWSLSKTQLSASGITISSNGNLKGDGQGGGSWEITRGNAKFNSIEANSGGTIAGWKISANALTSPTNGMTIRSEGSLYGPNNNWYINKEGNATFKNITCDNIFSIGNGSNSWTSNGSGSTFAFGSGSIALGNPGHSGSSVNHGISYSNGSVKIGGSIYAENGYFSGEIVAKTGNIGGWDIDTDGLVKGTVHLYPTGISTDNIDVLKLENLRFSIEDISAETIYDAAKDGTTALSKVNGLMNGAQTGTCTITIPQLSVSDNKTESKTVNGTCSIQLVVG